MTTAEYEVIRSWIRYWEKVLLDKPKELVLGKGYRQARFSRISDPLGASKAGKGLEVVRNVVG
jgi:hypothetical protein